MCPKLSSLGHLVARLQIAPGQIEGALAELRIEPSLTLNGVGYWDEEAGDRVSKHLRHRAAERILGRPISEEQTDHA